MVLLRWLYTEQIQFLFLIKNLFLAWIPYGLSVIIVFLYGYTAGKLKKIAMFILGIAWLLFFPNAPYMLTDFIHYRGNLSFIMWYDLVIYALFIFNGFLLGFVSIYYIYRIIEKEINILVGWLFVLFVLFLSGYGIYLGRFIRWNSWDILFRPMELINSAIEHINIFSIIFSLIFGTLLTLTYAFLYILTFLSREKIGE